MAGVSYLGSGQAATGRGTIKRTGRRGYGIEFDPHYCDVIVKRLMKSAKVEAVHGATGKTFSATEAEQRAADRESVAATNSAEVA